MPPPDHARRRAAACAALPALDVDALLVTDVLHVRWLTGATVSHGAVLLRAEGDALVATDGRYAEDVASAVPDLELVVDRGAARAVLARAGSARVGLERHAVTLAAAAALASTGPALVGVESPVLTLRASKDEAEVAAVAAASDVADRAWQRLLPELRAGLTERQVAARLDALVREEGADAAAFDTIVAAGEHGAQPHHRPCGRPLEEGDLVTVDWGARRDGYHSDCTRTVAVGEPAAWQRELHALVLAAADAGLAALAPDLGTRELDAAARDVVADAGHGEHFPHGLGHGVGLAVHEAPWVGPTWLGTVADRATVTVEPGVYLPGRGGVRVEDLALVGAGGARRLTRTDRALLVVG